MKGFYVKFTTTVLIILLSFSSFAFAKGMSILQNKVSEPNKKLYSIVVDLTDNELHLVDNNTKQVKKTYTIAGGKPSTPSPLGTWTIINKEVGWGGGFGTRWMGLNVPWGKYGIHGTNKPLSIGGTISLGCIRMLNKDVEELYRYAQYGTTVIIYGGPYGLYNNQFRMLIPGDRGADVFEVQRKLKDRGYYSGKLDGIYGETMKSDVINFKKDSKLKNTHTLDKDFYEALGIRVFE